MSTYSSLSNPEPLPDAEPLPDPEPTTAQIAVIASLVTSQSAALNGRDLSFLAVGRQTIDGGWQWRRVSTEPSVAPDVTIAARIRDLELPTDCTAIGLVSRATARRLDAPTAPGVPVMVVYATTKSVGSVSLVAYPDGPAIWSTSPTGALAEAAGSVFQPVADGRLAAGPELNNSDSLTLD